MIGTNATNFTPALVTGMMGHTVATTDFDVTNATTNSKTTNYYDWKMGNIAQISTLIDLSNIVNTNGTDNYVVGFSGTNAAAEILLLPDGAKIIHMTSRVVELSNAANDTYSIFAHNASINENSAGAGVELLDAINANSTGLIGIKIPTVDGIHNSSLRYIFLVNNGTNTTSGNTARTRGKILLTMIVSLAQ